MNVLVTGASGFLGSHICEQLNQQGHTIRAIVRKSSDVSLLKKMNHVELIYTALNDTENLTSAAKGMDAIIHSAALVKAKNESEFYKVNCMYTENLLDAAEQTLDTLKRFVLVSSLAALGPHPSGQIIRNNKIPSPVTGYGRSKLAADMAAQKRAEKIPVTILRPVSIYGPRDKGILSFFQIVNRRIMPYFGSSKTRIMLIYGSDCASACIKAIDADVPSGSAYLLDDGHVSNWKEVGCILESLMGKKIFLKFPVPRSLMTLIAGLTDVISQITGKAFILSVDKLNELYGEFVTDNKEACDNLDWQPQIKLKEGLSLTLDWYKKNGWL